MRNSDGFTLIELMIVVAIIALLAAISIPIYQTYVARSQLAVALDELRPGRTTIESHIAEGKNASLIDAGYVGLRTSQRCTHVSAQMQADTRAELSCELAGTPSVAGKTMRLVRNTEGIWTCNTSEFDARLRPVGCS